MHVALLSPSWLSAGPPNGISTYVHALRQGLQRHGHRVSVFAFHVPSDATDDGIYRIAETPGFRVRRKLFSILGREPRPPFDRGSLIATRIMEVHKANPIDVVEMEESFGWCADVARRIPAPVVVKLHGPAFLSLVDEESRTPEALNKIEAEGRGLRSIDVITSPSRKLLEQTVARYGLEPGVRAVVPNPMYAEARNALWDPARCEPATVVFVGRFDRRKGGDLLLLAFRALIRDKPDARLVFAGPDNGVPREAGGRIQFEEFCRAHFSDEQRQRIEYLGPLERSETFGLRLRGAVTAIASRWDNQPNTALEAMLQCCPVVAFDTGGVGELVEHGVTGLLATANDVEDFAGKLKTLMEDVAEATRLGRAARDYVLREHSIDAVTAQVLDLYRRAISLAAGECGPPAATGESRSGRASNASGERPRDAQSAGDDAETASILASMRATLRDLPDVARIELLEARKPVADATTKLLLSGSDGSPHAVAICGRDDAAKAVAASVANAREAKATLGSDLDTVVLSPILAGSVGEIRYVVWPFRRPAVGTRPWTFARRVLLRGQILEWLREVAITTLQPSRREGIDDFAACLEALRRHAALPEAVREDAAQALQRLASGAWVPRHAFAHFDLWMENILLAPRRSMRHGSGRFDFVVIDWGGARLRGYPIYDLIRFADSARVGGPALRKELRAHCRILGCDPRDARSYLLAALGVLGANLHHLPPERYVALVGRCVDVLEAAEPRTW